MPHSLKFTHIKHIELATPPFAWKSALLGGKVDFPSCLLFNEAEVVGAHLHVYKHREKLRTGVRKILQKKTILILRKNPLLLITKQKKLYLKIIF